MKATREPKFKVGQHIEWKSQSAGSWKTKTGKIIAIVAVNESITETLERLGYDSYECVVSAQTTARIPRYLVDTTPDGSKSKNQIYAPDFARAEKRGKVVGRG